MYKGLSLSYQQFHYSFPCWFFTGSPHPTPFCCWLFAFDAVKCAPSINRNKKTVIMKHKKREIKRKPKHSNATKKKRTRDIILIRISSLVRTPLSVTCWPLFEFTFYIKCSAKRAKGLLI